MILKKEINGLAILINTVLILGAINGVISETNSNSLGRFLMLLLLVVLVRNLLRIVQVKVRIQANENGISYNKFLFYTKRLIIDEFDVSKLSLSLGPNPLNQNVRKSELKTALSVFFGIYKGVELRHGNKVLIKGLAKYQKMTKFD